MIPQEIREMAEKIGQFYLQKNSGNYATTAREIADLQISKIEVAEKEISITTARPGLLIGHRGMNIDSLAKFLQTKVRIIEEMDPLISWLIPRV